MPYTLELETKPVLKRLPGAHAALAELKASAKSIPNQEILINTLTIQEAKDSSEVENIVTTHDDIFKESLSENQYVTLASKEVENYISALKRGFGIVSRNKILTANHLIEIQQVLEKNKAGFRKTPGTNLKNQRTGEVVYAPPQHPQEIVDLMSNLEAYINDEGMSDYDPLVKMAIIHFQFESIHPFYDGNGRTGRILNVLYLVLSGLLDIPVLYLSRYVIQNKETYYRLIQQVRDQQNWEEWLLFMIEAIEKTARGTLRLVEQIQEDMMYTKHLLRSRFKKIYSHEMLNHLFMHPYTKIEFVEKELEVSRPTASSYLNKLAEAGVLTKSTHGKSNYYINNRLVRTLTGSIF